MSAGTKPRRYALGLDIGTSAVKASLLADDGVTDTATSPGYPTANPQSGHAEQDPDDWWRAVGDVLAELLGRHSEVDATTTTIGLTGQMHTSVMRDEVGALVRPAILWSDRRAVAECEALSAAHPRWAEVTGNSLIPAFTAAHLAWVRAHEPELFARVRTVSVAKDEIRSRLGAGWATEPTDASAMCLMDTRTDQWSADLLGAVGITSDALPPIVPSGSVTGMVHDVPGPMANRRLLGAQVVGGAGDQFALAIALGVVEGDSLGLSLGTSGAAVQSLTAPRLGAFRHAYPDRWLALDSTHAAGLALAWWSAIVPTSFGEVDPVDHLTTHPAPTFLPYLQGQRSGRGAPGTLTDLHVSHGPADLAYAVLEGVAQEMVRLARSVSGSSLGPGAVGIGGRAGLIPGLRALIAAGLDRPVRFSDRGSAFGAAVLAAQGAGWFDPAIHQVSHPADLTAPEPALSAHLADRLRRRQHLIEALT